MSALAEDAGVRTASGRPLSFVPPAPASPYYEVAVYETGRVPTRPGNWHDLFNALAWLAFPRTKAVLNELHARQIPLEPGRRGPLRDLLTLFDEGGAIVACGDPELETLARGARWRELFWECRTRVLAGMRVFVLGHAVLEKARVPFAGITCKCLFVGPGADPDRQAAGWLAARTAQSAPRDLPSVPVFGFPGWLPQSASAGFYDDARYFRPLRAIKSRPGAGQAAAALRAEESPGSAERDAG